MSGTELNEAVRLAERAGCVLVATADASGTPHVAVAGRLTAAGDDAVCVSAWFCPGTVENLAVNRRVALVAWDRPSDHGLQLIGTVEAVEEAAVMDGFEPGLEPSPPIPQVERVLRVSVEWVMHFALAPHSDEPI